MNFESEEVPCETCGRSTRVTGTKRCDGCWEVEHRLRRYLREGEDKAVAFVESILTAEKSTVNIYGKTICYSCNGTGTLDAAQLHKLTRVVHRLYLACEALRSIAKGDLDDGSPPLHVQAREALSRIEEP